MIEALRNNWLWGIGLLAVIAVLAVSPLCAVAPDDLVRSLNFRPVLTEAELEPAALVRVGADGSVAETLCTAPASTGAATEPVSARYSGTNYLGRAMPPLALIGSALAGTSLPAPDSGAFSLQLEALAKRHLPGNQLNAAVGRLMDTEPGCSAVVREHLASGAFVCGVRAILLRGEGQKIGLQLASLCLTPSLAGSTHSATPPVPPPPFWAGVRETLALVEFRQI